MSPATLVSLQGLFKFPFTAHVVQPPRACWYIIRQERGEAVTHVNFLTAQLKYKTPPIPVETKILTCTTPAVEYSYVYSNFFSSEYKYGK